jgi:hypothetical protein
MTSRSRCAALAACVTAFAVPAMADPPLTTGDAIHANGIIRYNYAELVSVQGAPSFAARIEGATSVCVADSVIFPKRPDDVPYREAAVDRDLKSPCFPACLVGLRPAALPRFERPRTRSPP